MMTPLPLSSEQVSITGSHARTWLLGLYELICTDISIPIASILQILIGCWICEKALLRGGEQSGAQFLAYEVHRRLEHGKQETFSTLLNSDAALILLSAGILHEFDIKNTTLELFIQEVNATIQILEDQDRTEAAKLFVTRFLLHNLHLHPSLGAYTINSPRNALGMNLLQADELVIRSLVADIAAATAYGQRFPLAEPELLRQLNIAVPVWMLYYLRQRNLEVGTLLLRTMNYLHLREDIAFQMGLSFVLGQQQLDGRFGFLAPEISELRSIKLHFNDIFELYLPLTVSCLWAIAEAMSPDFILYRSI